MNIFKKLFHKHKQKAVERKKNEEDIREQKKWYGILDNINNYDGTSKGQKVIK